MEKISFNDIIFATAMIRGAVATTLRLSGLNSVADVVSAVKKELGSFSGLLTISVRNMTQGWSKQKSLYLAAAAPLTLHQTAGIQLSLFDVV